MPVTSAKKVRQSELMIRNEYNPHVKQQRQYSQQSLHLRNDSQSGRDLPPIDKKYEPKPKGPIAKSVDEIRMTEVAENVMSDLRSNRDIVV